jgi:fatty acid-binding protein DegV
MPTIKLDDGEYDVETLTDAQKKLIAELQKIEERIKERNNLVAILTKAKRAYIADLKQEMISSKAGLDLFE